MIHITFDLETLGNSFNAPIVQIGAVKFDLEEVYDEFKVNVNWMSLADYDFTIDYSTVLWWLSQTREAQDSIIDQGGAVDIKKALNDFGRWIGVPEDYIYWSHATFDPVILDNSYRKTGIRNPIPFRNQRDIRTLEHFAGRQSIENRGVSHDALDDAKFQAEYIILMLKKLQ